MLLLCLYKHFIHDDVLFTELEHILRHLIVFVQCLKPEFVTFTLPQHFTCVTSVELCINIHHMYTKRQSKTPSCNLI